MGMFRTTPPVETMLGAHGTGALRALDAALRAFHDEDIGDDIRGATDGGGGGGVGGVGGVDGAPAPRPALLCGSLAEVQSALRTLTAQARSCSDESPDGQAHITGVAGEPRLGATPQ